MLKRVLIILILCLFITSAVSAWNYNGDSSAAVDDSVEPYVDTDLIINTEYTNDPNATVTLYLFASDYEVPNDVPNRDWRGLPMCVVLWNGEATPQGLSDNGANLTFEDFIPEIPGDGWTWSIHDRTLPGGEGEKRISGILAIPTGTIFGGGPLLTEVSRFFTGTLIVDTTSPTGSVSIDYDVTDENGIRYVNSPVVTLTINAIDNYELDKIKIWNDQLNNEPADWSNRSDSDFWSFTRSWALSANDGTKKVYVKFKDKAGNESDPYHDTITLDTTSPEGGSIAINNGDSATASNVVDLNITLPSDNISGSDQIEMWVENTDNPPNSTNWITWDDWMAIYNNSWDLPFSDGIRQVRIKFRDAAENATGWRYSEEIIVDKTPPVPGQPPISVQGATEYEGTNYITDPAVVLNLDATDNFPPIKMFITHTEQELSNNDGLAVAVGIDDMEMVGYIPFGGGDDGWLDYTPTHEWLESLNSGLLHTFKVKFKDTVGNTTDWHEYQVVYDATSPAGEVSVIGRTGYEDSVREYEGARYAQRERLSLDTFNVSDDTAWIKISGDISSVMDMGDTPGYIDNWIEYTPNDYVHITLNSNEFPGNPSMEQIMQVMTKQVNVQFKDKAGNVSDLITREIILDKHIPAIPTITSPSATVQDITLIAGEANDIIEDNLWIEHPGGSGIASVKVRINRYWNGDHYYYYESDWLQSGWSNWDGDADGDGVIDYIIWHEATINDLGDGTAAWELPFTLPQNPPWDDSVPYTITINARAYDKAGNDNSTGNIPITINQSAPPSTPEVFIRKEGDDVVLSWDPANGASSYKVYRKANFPYFSAIEADASSNTGNNEWTHYNAVGDPNANYYYFVVAVSESERESDPSNRVGEFDFELIHNEGIPSVNAVTLVLDPAQSQNAMQMDAEGLANVIPNCSSVAEWVAGTQSYNEHPIGVPFNNFEANVGHPYFVTVTADEVWTQVGGVPEEGSPEFALIHNNGIPSVNAISVKLNRDDIVDAEGLANDIPNCSSAAEWVAETQSYNEHPIGVPFNNFSVKPGYPYFVGMTANQTW